MSVFLIIALVILCTAIYYRSVSESNLTRRYIASIQAFWLAEAGANRALSELRAYYNINGNDLWATSLGQGTYSADVITDGNSRIVLARGRIPYGDSGVIEKNLNVVMRKYIPPNFYDNGIYSGGDINTNGDSYEITGDVLYAEELSVEHPENISGTATQDPTASPLARLDFNQLLALSTAQGNVYDSGRLDDVKKGQDSFPATFWYLNPIDPNDPTTGTPNIVYVTSDLELNGNIGTIGGMFIVVGDVVTNPGETQDTTINGNGQIEGVVYTRGIFRINGGGDNLNVNGGVWAGQEARLNGNAHIAYNSDYMASIQALDIDAEVQVTSWREQENPYRLNP
ncbi:MAG: hypothetical protein ABH872_02165 [Candidatus Omnitrophota bacterium]